MIKRIKTKATYEGGVLKPQEPIDLLEGANVEIIILDENLTKEFETKETLGLMKLLESNPALDFLKDEREDIYTVDDLKERYK